MVTVIIPKQIEGKVAWNSQIIEGARLKGPNKKFQDMNKLRGSISNNQCDLITEAKNKVTFRLVFWLSD